MFQHKNVEGFSVSSPVLLLSEWKASKTDHYVVLKLCNEMKTVNWLLNMGLNAYSVHIEMLEPIT